MRRSAQHPRSRVGTAHRPVVRARGTAVIAVVAVLVLVELVVLGAVFAGVRDGDASALGVEGLRARYAAEAGVRLALRELATATDEDGDGTVGTISDDGDDATDPAIGAGGAAVRVTIDGSEYVASARAGRAVREIRFSAAP